MGFGCKWWADGRFCSKTNPPNCHKWGTPGFDLNATCFFHNYIFDSNRNCPRQCKNCHNNPPGIIILHCSWFSGWNWQNIAKVGKYLGFHFKFWITQYHWEQHYFHWSLLTFNCFWPHFLLNYFLRAAHTSKCRFTFFHFQLTQKPSIFLQSQLLPHH